MLTRTIAQEGRGKKTAQNFEYFLYLTGGQKIKGVMAQH